VDGPPLLGYPRPRRHVRRGLPAGRAPDQPGGSRRQRSPHSRIARPPGGLQSAATDDRLLVARFWRGRTQRWIALQGGRRHRKGGGAEQRRSTRPALRWHAASGNWRLDRVSLPARPRPRGNVRRRGIGADPEAALAVLFDKYGDEAPSLAIDDIWASKKSAGAFQDHVYSGRRTFGSGCCPGSLGASRPCFPE
jgi:hypothetical protein